MVLELGLFLYFTDLLEVSSCQPVVMGFDFHLKVDGFALLVAAVARRV